MINFYLTALECGDDWDGPGYYFWDEVQATAYGPYDSFDKASLARERYAEFELKGFYDYYNNRIYFGSTVAFNYSGEVRIGTVVDVVPYRKYGQIRFKIVVRHHQSNTESNVSNTRNLVVLVTGVPPNNFGNKYE